MNFLKKKLKPLTSGLSAAPNSSKSAKNHRDLEDDLYDEYVVEAPPHPSELLALGVDPDQIDANDPDKLRELYRKAKAEGKDKKANSVLLARQRQREEIEEKKKTREEWKYFDSITARVEQVVRESQRNLDQWKESSAVSRLTEPEYELRLTPDQVFKSSAGVKQENSEENWIDFGGDEDAKRKKKSDKNQVLDLDPSEADLDEFGCPREPQKRASIVSNPDERAARGKLVVEELRQDLGLDLRSTEEKRKAEEEERRRQVREQLARGRTQEKPLELERKTDIDLKAAARPRPRPKSGQQENTSAPTESQTAEEELDPFDTSFVASIFGERASEAPAKEEAAASYVDPFDTSHVNL